jgi:hypothetical protein
MESGYRNNTLDDIYLSQKNDSSSIDPGCCQNIIEHDQTALKETKLISMIVSDTVEPVFVVEKAGHSNASQQDRLPFIANLNKAWISKIQDVIQRLKTLVLNSTKADEWPDELSGFRTSASGATGHLDLHI